MNLNRVEKLLQRMPELGVDAFLITGGTNRTYLSGFKGSSGFLLITGQKQFILTDFRYLDQAAEEAPGFEVVRIGPKAAETLGKLVLDTGCRRLGFEAHKVSYEQYQEFFEQFKGSDLVPVSKVVEKIRALKEPEEIDLLKSTVEIADRAFEDVLRFIRPGVPEREVAAKLEYTMRTNGAEKASFDIIVASGARGALPHGSASGKKIQKGDLVVIDFGARFHGYCSDMTRTIMVGNAESRQREVYDLVLKAQRKALGAVKPGVICRDLDAVARETIIEGGYADSFGHGLGHGVGMQVHEEPSVNTVGETVLMPGMVITVEPGIYIKDWGGIRIEDMVVVTDNGCEVLTSTTKQLLEL